MRLLVLLLFSGSVLALLLTVGCAATGGGPNTGSPAGNPVWERVAAPAGSTRLRMVSINSSGTIFIAERSLGFFRSSDNGATWTPINSGISGTSGWTINVGPGALLVASTFVATTGNVVYYRSTDNGDHWAAIPGNYTFSNVGAYSGVAFAQNGNLIFGGFWSPGSQSAVSYSTDGGLSSAIASSNPLTTAVMGTNYNPVGHDLWMGTEAKGLYRSTDNGLTWQQTFDNGTMGNNRSFAFNQAGQVLVATLTGLWRSSDSSGTAWTKVLGGDGRMLFVDTNSNIYYSKKVDSDPTAVYRSADGGSSWQRFDAGLSSGQDGVQYFAQNPVDGKIYATPDGPDLYRTLN